MPVTRLTLIGTGLIGASVGLAARRAGVRVAGWDPDAEALALAAERGAVDEPAATAAAALSEAELAVVAAPIGALPAQVAAVLAATSERTTVTDVGSTKVSVLEAAGGSPRFVGGHPLSGKEVHGPENASAELFDGATWFLTPTARTDHTRHRLVHGFVSDLGAIPRAIDPDVHDRLVALTSHLPHVIANVIANQAGASPVEGHDPLVSGGGALRDMTRVAGTNPRLWVEIFLDNAAAVREALGEHRRRIDEVERALERQDEAFLAAWAAEAGENRRRMLGPVYRDPGHLYRLQVHVPDEPGVLADITVALGAERINISDFELQHISPEFGGTVTVLVTGEDEAQRAATLLESRGYGVTTSAVLDDE
jgi:prephenate dehydrogenase